MTIDELIKILENYEVFVDDDYGGSYKSVIAYAPDKKVSRAHTPIGTLKIIDTFEEIQKENQNLKKQLEEGILESLYFDMITDENIIFKNQQKEFIEWLERRLFLLRDEASELALGMCSTNYQDTKIEVYKEVLSKYKEIIGSEVENNAK